VAVAGPSSGLPTLFYNATDIGIQTYTRLVGTLERNLADSFNARKTVMHDWIRRHLQRLGLLCLRKIHWLRGFPGSNANFLNVAQFALPFATQYVGVLIFPGCFGRFVCVPRRGIEWRI